MSKVTDSCINKLESNIKKLSELSSQNNQGTDLNPRQKVEYKEYIDSAIRIFNSPGINPVDINEAIGEYVLEHLTKLRNNPASGIFAKDAKGKSFILDRTADGRGEPYHTRFTRHFVRTKFTIIPTSTRKYRSSGFRNFILQESKPDKPYDEVCIKTNISWDDDIKRRLHIDVEIEVSDLKNQYGGGNIVKTSDTFILYIKYLN